jgi:hypothetical protein
MSVKADLIAARALIDTPEKWWADKTTERDLLGVLVAATGRTFDADRVLPMCDALDGACSPARPGAIVRPYVDFADTPATTLADVLALFDRAIEAAT